MAALSKIELEDALKVLDSLEAQNIFPSKSRWLITGASGFLGSQFLNVLRVAKERGLNCEVVALDSNIRGDYREWYFDNCEFLEFDITNPWPHLGSFTHILHLASIASPIYYRQFPLETLYSNYEGTKNALEAARTQEARLLLMSSSEIYGDPTSENIPTTESYRGNVSSIGPRACYDEGKRVMETLAWIYSDKYDMNISIARPFNFYGPGMRLDDGRVLPDMFNSIIAGSDIILYSDGKPTRSFCYVSDAIQGLFTMVLSKQNWKLYNVGNPASEISMLDLAHAVAREANVLGWEGSVKFEISEEPNYLINNPQRRVPDTTLIKDEIAWEAKIDLPLGIRRSLQHFMELYK
jgi:UDP-glucuronate decarboxylase